MLSPNEGLDICRFHSLRLDPAMKNQCAGLTFFTGSGRRREWSDEQKAQIVAESNEPGVKVCSVARRDGLTPQQLFTWRRLARKPLGAVPDVDVPMFAPAVLDVPTTPVAKEQESRRAARRKPSTGAISVPITSTTVFPSAVLRVPRLKYIKLLC